jgi:PIN domain-containing protein
VSERVVFDTSSLVSAILRPGSLPDLALQKALQSWEVCASAETFAELEAVLGREKFDRYTDRRQRNTFVVSFRRDCRFFVVPDADPGSLAPRAAIPATISSWPWPLSLAPTPSSAAMKTC